MGALIGGPPLVMVAVVRPGRRGPVGGPAVMFTRSSIVSFNDEPMMNRWLRAIIKL